MLKLGKRACITGTEPTTVDHELPSKPTFKVRNRVEAVTTHKIDPLEVNLFLFVSLSKRVLQLPAARFRYMKWTDIDGMQTKGPQLGQV